MQGALQNGYDRDLFQEEGYRQGVKETAVCKNGEKLQEGG
jgi:hypothetical protein